MKRILWTVMSLWVTGPAFAVSDPMILEYLPESVTYDPSIPTPESHFGYSVGRWHLRHDQIVSYLQALAVASDRIVVRTYAKTYEDRSLLLLTITSTPAGVMHTRFSSTLISLRTPTIISSPFMVVFYNAYPCMPLSWGGRRGMPGSVVSAIAHSTRYPVPLSCSQHPAL